MIEKLPAKLRGKGRPKRLRFFPIRKRRAENIDIDLPIALTGDDRKRASIIGTLSFPASGKEHCSSWDNSDIISDIIRRRRPGLLLCAGWSVPGVAELAPVRAAAKRAKTIVVLETTSPKSYWRLGAGHLPNKGKMGKQIFAFRKQTDKDPR
jgi:hypothetical protein